MGRGPGSPLPSEFPWRRHRELLGMEGGALQEKAHFPSCFHTPQQELSPFTRADSSRGQKGCWSANLHSPLFPFQDIDKFGNEITQLARPLPVEYLIIDVSVCPKPQERAGARAAGGRRLVQAKAREGSWLP